MRVMLADDDESMRDLISAVVGSQGHTVEAFANGASAWEAYAKSPAPLVVLDWQMPGVDGLEVCRRIRAHADGAETYLLVVTARGGSKNLDSVLDAGADDYLSKPVSPEDIVARLRIAERRMEIAAARRSAEEELQRARYLAGVGEVSIAIQHEINNPLAALLTNSALVAAGIVPPAEIAGSLRAIDEQARRIAAVVRRLNEIVDPRSVEYAFGQRMVDLAPPPVPPAVPAVSPRKAP